MSHHRRPSEHCRPSPQLSPPPSAPLPMPPSPPPLPMPPYGDEPPPGVELRCRACGCGPAAAVTFRGHQGMIIIMRFLSTSGPFCRDCGLSVFRDMTARTLLQGWYGVASVVINPIIVLCNLLGRGRVARLPAPRRPWDAPSGRPMNPGPALLARPIAVAGLALAAGLVASVLWVWFGLAAQIW